MSRKRKNGIPEVTLEDTYEKDDLVFLSMEYDRINTSAISILNGEKYTGVP